MTDAMLALLRCPLDPEREAILTQADHTLTCSGCHVTFAIKNGLPILTPDQAVLPEGVDAATRLPCVRRSRPGHRDGR
jgi:uncharacterized protein YbaR (Trm112 family)